MKNFDNFNLLSKKLFKSIVLGFVLFGLIRILFAIRFGSLQVFSEFSSDIIWVVLNGIRFDLQAICYLFVLVFVLNLAALFSGHTKLISFLNGFAKIYIPIILSLAIFLLLGDHQFYSFFKSHFNGVAFDFLQEEPGLLLQSIWKDHPVIKILLAILLVFVSTRLAIKRIYNSTKGQLKPRKFLAKLGLSLIFIGLYFVMVRGSVGMFPLEKEDITVSENDFINACVPNGLYALKEAMAEKKREFKIKSPAQLLKANGYNSIDEVIADYYELPLDSIKGKPYTDFLFKESPKKKDSIKYNVVYLLMESMSDHFLDFHSDSNNLLGALAPHLKEDILFRNFQSSGNGTIYSLENILLNSPFHPLFDTKYRMQAYDLSIAKPFKEMGYVTEFITGIELGWRHLNEALKIQHFDYVEGKAKILRSDSSASSNQAWGVYDHSLLDYIFNKLSQSDSSQFVFSLTSTNHTPYQLPADYKRYPLAKSLKQFPEISATYEKSIEAFEAYQYSNNALGLFMNKIKTSELKENTIVIATGDHNVRSIVSYNSEATRAKKYAVPFYVYLPPSLKETIEHNAARWGSHYDIMSTIYPLVLDSVLYPNLGQNMFDTSKQQTAFYSLNDNRLLFDENADKEAIKKKVKARKVLVKYHYSKLFTNFNKQ